MIPLYTNRTGMHGNADAAFQTTSREMLPHIPFTWRRNPSTAPSPILPWMLRAFHHLELPTPQRQKDEHARGTTAPASSTSSGAAKSTAVSGEGRNGEDAPTDSVVASLARRGLVRKDPLLARLEKRQKVSKGSNGAASPAAVASQAAALSLSALPASHWTQHKLSEMTPTSWSVFREQLGIEVEAVNRKSPVLPQGVAVADGGGGGAGKAHRLYSVDMVRPLRCWEEEVLPYALGRCVAAKYALPTAIQSQCIPLAMKLLDEEVEEGNKTAPSSARLTEGGQRYRKKVDIVGIAETGSGKTMAYIVPLLADIRMNRRPNLLSVEDLKSQGPLGIVLVPTRELAEQVTKEVNELLGLQPPTGRLHSASKSTNANSSSSNTAAERHRAALLAWEAEELAAIRDLEQHRKTHNLLSEVVVVKLVGGEDEDAQYQALSQGAHIVVGTVGQISALLERRMLALGNTDFVVIDEADRMIAENHQQELVEVLTRCPLPRQTLLFTATLSQECADIAKKFLSPDGYLQVRTPYRCASIRQNFEMVSIVKAAGKEEEEEKEEARQGSGEKGATPASSTRAAGVAPGARRTRSPLIHPEKFARLVAWLAYGTGPIVVFAGERRTCDALLDELKDEREHLLLMAEQFSLEALIGPPPPGLLFVDDAESSSAWGEHTGEGGNGGASAVRGGALHVAKYTREAQRRQALESAAAAKARLQLDNLSSVAVVHSDLSQTERRRLVDLFSKGQRKVLLTTDLLARGLDVPGVTLVVNYDLPWPARGEAPREAVIRYIHRIGRTGRAGCSGVTVSLIGLAAEAVQQARQRFASTRAATSLASSVTGRTQGVAGGKVYAPGTSEAIKQRDREMATLIGGSGGDVFPIDKEDIDKADDYASEDEREEANADGQPQQQHQRRRLENGVVDDNTAAPAKRTFLNDEAILKPLWEFLRKCVSANCLELTTDEDAETLLKKRWYGKIDMEFALAAIMADRAAHGSKFGVIRN